MTQLYEQDYSQWAETMADLLASGNFTQLDIENLVEIERERANVNFYLKDSPSLPRYLSNESLAKIYPTARADGFSLGRFKSLTTGNFFRTKKRLILRR